MANIAQQLHTRLGVDDAAFRKQVKGDVSWNDFSDGLEESLRQTIYNVAIWTDATIQQCVSEGVANAEFNALANGTMRDCKHFADRLNEQIGRRAGRTGPTKNSNDYTDYISIGIELTNITEEIQTVSTNSLIALSEYKHLAEEKMRERAQQQDTAVITDVEAKVVGEEQVTA